jgi:hypothetical protein
LTSQPGPAPTETPASQLTKPLRGLAALVLVGANALMLLVGLINLLVPFSDTDTFTRRAGGAFVYFVGLLAILLPLLAVLLATHLQPVVPRAKLITQVALVEYAVAALFAVISFFGWLVGTLADAQFRLAFTGLLNRVADFGIFAIAAFVVFKIWRTLYYVPKPKSQPGVYGRPQSAPPHGQPGYPQAGYQQPYGQQPGYPAGQPQAYGQPATYGAGYPAAQPTFAPGHAPGTTHGGYSSADATQVAAYHPPQAAAPASAPPAPASAPPASAPPAPADAPASAPPASWLPGFPTTSPASAPASAPPASAPPAPAPASAPPASSAPAPAPASAPPASSAPAPASAPPAPPAPVLAPPASAPASAPPAQTGPSSVEPTQVIPRMPDSGEGSEATQMIIPASRRPASNDDDGSNRRG